MGESMNKVILLAAALLLTVSANAAEKQSQSKTKVEVKEEVKKDQVDQLITNRKLRAETGSKSKYSVSTAFTYNGGTINDPGSRFRPNITAGANVPTFSSLAGSISGKYRLNVKDSLNAGVGLRAFQPFHESPDKSTVEAPNGEPVQRADIYNPYVTYTHIDRIAGLQSVSKVTATALTTDFSRQLGYLGQVDLTQIFLKDLGTSGASVGVLFGTGFSVFDKFDEASQAASSDYWVGAYPFFEYVINDTFNFRTISGVWVYEHIRNESRALTFSKNTIYQSVGLGISVSRDVYLYPNIQFVPEDISGDRTNVAITANVNLF